MVELGLSVSFGSSQTRLVSLTFCHYGKTMPNRAIVKRVDDTTMAAWCIPLDAAAAGARIEGYVKARPLVRALRLCVQIGTRQNAVIGRLPPELVEMVARAVEDNLLYRDPVADETCSFGLVGSWARQTRILNRDDGLDVWPPKYCSEYRCSCLTEEETSSKLNEFIEEFGFKEPDSNSEDNKSNGIWQSKGILSTRLNEVLVLDFGIQIDFVAKPGRRSPFLEMFAYLMLPSCLVNGHKSSDDNFCTNNLKMTLDTMDMPPFSPELEQRFKVAIDRLGLRPYISIAFENFLYSPTETRDQIGEGDQLINHLPQSQTFELHQRAKFMVTPSWVDDYRNQSS